MHILKVVLMHTYLFCLRLYGIKFLKLSLVVNIFIGYLSLEDSGLVDFQCVKVLDFQCVKVLNFQCVKVCAPLQLLVFNLFTYRKQDVKSTQYLDSHNAR